MSKDTDAYRIFVPATNKIIHTRNFRVAKKITKRNPNITNENKENGGSSIRNENHIHEDNNDNSINNNNDKMDDELKSITENTIDFWENKTELFEKNANFSLIMSDDSADV